MTCRTQLRILDDFQTRKRPQYLECLFLDRMAPNIAECLNLGWADLAVDLTQRLNRGIDIAGFNDAGDFYHRRTQHFVLRLIANWQGWPERAGPKCAFDEPLFNALVDHWRTPNAADIAPLLLAGCDRHTHQARADSKQGFFDLNTHDVEYTPFEVLAVLKLRELHGLPNPSATELDHPLMNTPLGRLPEPTAPYTDELLEGVLARARQEFPDL
jgi:hypothetical protein